ncbi:MAG: GtrA family protein [Pseudohongiellaceae bacterium]
MKLAIQYSLLAAVAIAVNISAQDMSLYLYQGIHALVISVLVGTIAGLVCKYFLDKHYIFRYRSQRLRDDTGRFVAYTATGAGTTLIFWGFEFGFEVAFGTREARYAGAVIGLCIGYAIKYQLDKRFVFTQG